MKPSTCALWKKDWSASSRLPGVMCPFAPSSQRREILARVLPDFSVDPVLPPRRLLLLLMSKLFAYRPHDTKGGSERKGKEEKTKLQGGWFMPWNWKNTNFQLAILFCHNNLQSFTKRSIFVGKEVREMRRRERGNTQGSATKKSAVFTHFLTHKCTLLSTFSNLAVYVVWPVAQPA